MTVLSGPLSDTRVRAAAKSADGVSGYRDALPEYKLDLVQTGRGSEPTRTWLVEEGGVTMGCTSIAFPMFGHFRSPHDAVTVIAITSAPPSARWAGVDLEPGTVLVYGPDVHHTGISPAGLELTYLTYRIPPMEEGMGRRAKMPEPGTAAVFEARAIGGGLAAEMETFAASAVCQQTGMSDGVEDLIDKLVRKQPSMTSRRLTASRLIVGECIKVVNARGAATTMPELLRAASASPRRLRQAFSDTYGVPPMRYLQLRVLNTAHKRLSTNGNCNSTVTHVATDLGVAHMGRFAARYREVFGEPPSETISRARSLEVGGAV